MLKVISTINQFFNQRLIKNVTKFQSIDNNPKLTEISFDKMIIAMNSDISARLCCCMSCNLFFCDYIFAVSNLIHKSSSNTRNHADNKTNIMIDKSMYK